MKRENLIESKDDSPEIYELLISNLVEFKRYYNREITRVDIIILN